MVKVNDNLNTAVQQRSAPLNMLTLDELTTALAPLTKQLEDLTQQQNKLTEQQNVLTQQQNTLTKQQSTLASSISSQTPSTKQTLEGELSAIVNKQNEVLTTLVESVNGNATYQLPNGQKVTANQLQALEMMNHLDKRISALEAQVAANTAETKQKSTVTFDNEKVGQWAAQKINDTVGQSLTAVFTKERQSMETTGQKIVEDISAATKADIGDQAMKWERHNNAVEAAAKFREKVERDMNPMIWAWVALPFVMAFLLAGGLLWGILQATGTQQITHWGWGLALGSKETPWHRVGGVVVLAIELIMFVGVTWWMTTWAAAALNEWSNPWSEWKKKKKTS